MNPTRFFLLILLLACSFSQMSCKKGCTDSTASNYDPNAKRDGDCCFEQIVVRHANVNFKDLNPSSSHYNQIVAVFRFTQTATSYSGSACPAMISSTTLEIQNTTNQRMLFDYNIDFNLNAVHWQYQDYSVVETGQTLNIGEINSNPASIELGQITIVSVNPISYQ